MRLPSPLDAAFEVGDRLGQGSFSQVVRATDRATGEPRAIKVIDKARLVTSEERAMPRREIEALRRVGPHAHALRLFSTFENEDHVFLVLELAERGSLLDVIRAHPFGLPEPESRRIMGQLLAVVAHLHALGHVHLDVAPGNVLLDKDGQVKLADFGLSRRVSDSDLLAGGGGEGGEGGDADSPSPLPHALLAQTSDAADSADSASDVPDEDSSAPSRSAAAAPASSTSTSSSALLPLSKKVSSSSLDGVPTELGTIGYVAPEVLNGHFISELADAWSCGAILHELVTGTTPVFAGDADRPADSAAALDAFAATFPDSLWGDGKPQACLDLCRGLLESDHDRRWTAAEALASPWLDLPA